MLCTLLLLGGAVSAQAQALEAYQQEINRESWERQQAQALERLKSWQRRDYFEERRTLELRHSDQRVAALGRSERCLNQARGFEAVMACQQREQLDMAQLRQQQMAEWSQLRQRYGLPVLPRLRPEYAGRWSPRESTSQYPSHPGYRQAPPLAPHSSDPSPQAWPDSWLDLLFWF
ncbi:MAG: hypothetical protein ACOVNL_13370 [Prochlorococcaceae cyanobacterium]|jgi:hypothetical protein